MPTVTVARVARRPAAIQTAIRQARLTNTDGVDRNGVIALAASHHRSAPRTPRTTASASTISSAVTAASTLYCFTIDPYAIPSGASAATAAATQAALGPTRSRAAYQTR